MMNEKRKSISSEEEMIRKALLGIDVPIERKRLKQSFLQNAAIRFAPPRRWADIYLPRLAWASVVFSLVGACLYLWLTFSSSAISHIQCAQAQDWRIRYQALLGNVVPYRRGDELRLVDGSTIRCRKDSDMGVVFTLKERWIELRRGTIEITASKNVGLPMIVKSGTARIRVIGTVFVVSTDEPAWRVEG